MRICEICGQEKPLTDFHRNKSRPLGRTYICKICERKRDKERKRIFTPEQLQRIRDRQRRDYWLNKHKYTAKRMVAALVKTGEIKRKPCVICGDVKSLAHHPDYAKPLEVIWLCHSHHYDAHEEMKNHK